MARRLLRTYQLPSEITDSPWLWSEPSIQTLSEDVDPCKIGKWMMFLNKTEKDINGFTRLDKAWPSVMDLVSEGILIDAKSSTSMVTEGKDTSLGVIICYTDDYTKKNEVREAAEALRNAIPYPCPMYYKTDNATRCGLYRSSGSKDVSMYKYSIDRKMYERDENRRWRLVYA